MLFSALWLITLRYGQKIKLLSRNKMAGPSLAYFLWVVIGALYSDLPDEAEKDIVLKVPFAAWTILLGSVAVFTRAQRDWLVKAFTLSLGIAIVFSFLTALYNYSVTGDQSELYFSKLVSFRMIPPHYLGMYINFAYAVLLFRFLVKKPFFQPRWINVALLSLYFVALIFLSVRMQFITFVVINLVVFGFFYRPARLYKKLLLAGGVLLVMFLSTILLPGPRSRMMDTVNEIVSFEGMVNDKQTNARKFLWTEGVEVCKEHFWLGAGTGAADDALNQRLEPINAKFWDGKTHYYLRDKNYNFHNAYLQHWATHGLIGFLIFLGLFLVPWLSKSTPTEGKLFLAVCALSFVTESMLQRQAGVLFFSFFYAVFFVLKPVEKKG